MRCSTLIYFNPNDPRTFVYKHERYKWIGVTMNFARARSYRVLAATLIPAFVLGWVFSRRNVFMYVRSFHPWAPIITFLGLVILYGIYISVIAYRGAATDLRRYPGKLSMRP